jgi:NTE family protein
VTAQPAPRARVPRLGLALGGGAALGLSHIGVLKVLAEEGIPVSCVAGTSAGSVVGAAFCAGLGWREIRDKARRLEWSHLASIVVPRRGVLRLDRMERFIENDLGVRSFSDLGIPFAAVAADITTGEEVVFDSGPLARAVRASCSIPGLFEPLETDGRILVDGGLVNDVPADVARRLGAEVVLAVNLNARRSHGTPPRNVADMVYYSFDILLAGCAQESLGAADFVICPDLQGFHYRDLRKIDELMTRGEQAVRPVIAQLKARLAGSAVGNGGFGASAPHA